MTRLQVRNLATILLLCAVVLAGCGGAQVAPEPTAPGIH